jgi:hypothetical protein
LKAYDALQERRDANAEYKKNNGILKKCCSGIIVAHTSTNHQIKTTKHAQNIATNTPRFTIPAGNASLVTCKVAGVFEISF